MSELYHWGIKGMHWGERRYQNYDGSLTTAGRARYGIGSAMWDNIGVTLPEVSIGRQTAAGLTRVRIR